MTTKKILVPIDGTERSMHSLNFIKENYSPEHVELHIINVKELVFIDGISMSDEIKTSEKNGRDLLDKARAMVSEFKTEASFTFGYAGDEIVRTAEDIGADIVVMTKSTKKGLTRIIGSCTAYVLKHAKCTLVIIPE
ncbi:universal stress protein [Peptostreptococcus sp. MV1]|uniref:universal stress protein n=1 Tax=Peptostreptococcus sp. MV1 TaxID=1219626 RepID=UPI00050E7F4D|nr:universal stress protein [Peptostreptococcus sp. MV1]KGF13273.1 universal stress protein [Peptostreptococcus sp. MV1]